MISTQKTGAYISQLRKRQNLTQAEMAGRLAVSPQAVSKWETGQALPDAEQLLGLSTLFGVSINAILAGADLAAAPSSEPTGTEPVTAEPGNPPADPAAVVRLAPFIDAQLLHDMIDRLGLAAFSQAQMEALAPFVGRDLLNRYVSQLPQIDARYLDGFAPHLSPRDLERLVDRIGAPLTAGRLIALAPFVTEERLGELFLNRARGVDPDDDDDEETEFDVLTALAPFLPTHLLKAELEAHPPQSFDELQRLAPFLDRAFVNLLTRRLMGGGGQP